MTIPQSMQPNQLSTLIATARIKMITDTILELTYLALTIKGEHELVTLTSLFNVSDLLFTEYFNLRNAYIKENGLSNIGIFKEIDLLDFNLSRVDIRKDDRMILDVINIAANNAARSIK